MISNSTAIQNMFCLYFVCVFAYNILALLVTKMMDSVWHAILDNFRPITVWATDLFIFYFITVSFGEGVSQYSWIQVLAVFVLIYGTLIYNAPNRGSLELKGGAASCFLDFSHEYAEIRAAEQITEGEGGSKQTSPYFHTMSPIQSPSQTKAKAAQAKYGALSQNPKEVGMTVLKKPGSFA
jgi:hypothetical protein